MKNKISDELTQEQFWQREYNLSHLAYEREFTFYNAVARGDKEVVAEMFLPLQSEGMGQLSENVIRNMKYHLIITISLITRFCIEAGLPPEDAYTLSDIFIRRLDVLEKESDIAALHREVIYDYTSRMESFRHQTRFPMHVSEIMDYVYNHLHEKITLDDISENLHMNKTYLCKLFLQETGFTIGDYILHSKIDAAQNMLRYSDYSSSAIANYLGFSTHSHFIASFKKVTHLTPMEYRRTYFRREFTGQK